MNSAHGTGCPRFCTQIILHRGKIELKKCFWYIISWRWEEDGTTSMATKAQSPGQVKMPQGYIFLEKIEITRVEFNTARRTLGT